MKKTNNKKQSDFWNAITLLANGAIIAAALGVIWSLFYTPQVIMSALINIPDKIFFGGVVIAVIKTSVELMNWAFNNLNEADIK